MPTRVLMTADTVGGVWTYALELAAALEPLGVSIGLATMGRRLDQHQARQVKAVGNLQLFESEYKLEWMDDPWDDVVAAGDWLLSLEQKVQPDLVHLNSYAHGALPWRAPKLVVAHSCVLSWWRAVHGVEAPCCWNRYRQAVRAGIRASDLFVAPSQAMLSMAFEHYGVLGASRVIRNGRKLPAQAPQSKQQIIFAAGRLWDAAKNVPALAAIAADVPWPVFLAGHTRPPGAAPQAGEQDPVADDLALTHLGHLSAEAMAAWLARAAIYVLPARYEPFGLTILEAALSRCALVLGDIPSLRELWDGAAVFVAPDDTEGLKEALRELISSATWRSRLGLEAAARARQYSREAMAAGYQAAYAELLRQSRPVADSRVSLLQTVQPVSTPGVFPEAPHPFPQAA